MKLRAILVAMCAATMLLPLGPARAAAQNGTFDIEYFPGNDGYNLCNKEKFPPGGVANPTNTNIGGACIEVNGTKKVRIVDIADDLSAQVSFYYSFMDENFDEVDGTPFLTNPADSLTEGCTSLCGGGCDSTPYLPAPAGSKYFYVFIESAVAGTLSAECDAGSFSSHGIITIQVATK